MRDPYSVLGIDRNAGENEIKEAYRALARKYHPDNYSDNPLSDLAGEKMQEINDAYDEIMRHRKRGGNRQGNAGYSGGSGYSDIRSMISSGKYDQAQELLDGVPPAKRDAEWYFLNGSVLYRRGWFDAAFTSFNTACNMDPGNPEYRDAFAKMKRRRAPGGYRVNTGGGSGGDCTACDICAGLMCADCLCRCCGSGC